jgi:hypothetical protein
MLYAQSTNRCICEGIVYEKPFLQESEHFRQRESNSYSHFYRNQEFFLELNNVFGISYIGSKMALFLMKEKRIFALFLF